MPRDKLYILHIFQKSAAFLVIFPLPFRHLVQLSAAKATPADNLRVLPI